VNGLKYAALIIRTSILSRIMRLGIFHDPRFDYEGSTRYAPKFGYPSSHEYALRRVRPESVVVDVYDGGGPGLMAKALAGKGVTTIALDSHLDTPAREPSRTEAGRGDKVDTILLLDVIEHQASPELLLQRVRSRYCEHAPEVVITTGNVAFLPVRLALFLGQFNYGKRGILDLTHTRLFTFSSLRRVLTQNGYDVVAMAGLPAPFPLAFGDGWLARMLLAINGLLITLSKGLFAYQIAMVAIPRPTLQLLLREAQDAGTEKMVGR